MILADDVGKLVGTKLIGQRPRRVAFEARGREQDWRRAIFALASVMLGLIRHRT